MDGIERIAIQEGRVYEIPANTRHRIVRETDEVYLEISHNGHEGFESFDTARRYKCFSKPAVCIMG